MLCYVMLCYVMVCYGMICFEIRKSMMQNLPMQCHGRYVIYEMMYKNYVCIIIIFNLLRKEWRLSCIIYYVMMKSMGPNA